MQAPAPDFDELCRRVLRVAPHLCRDVEPRRHRPRGRIRVRAEGVTVYIEAVDGGCREAVERLEWLRANGMHPVYAARGNPPIIVYSDTELTDDEKCLVLATLAATGAPISPCTC